MIAFGPAQAVVAGEVHVLAAPIQEAKVGEHQRLQGLLFVALRGRRRRRGGRWKRLLLLLLRLLSLLQRLRLHARPPGEVVAALVGVAQTQASFRVHLQEEEEDVTCDTCNWRKDNALLRRTGYTFTYTHTLSLGGTCRFLFRIVLFSMPRETFHLTCPHMLAIHVDGQIRPI